MLGHIVLTNVYVYYVCGATAERLCSAVAPAPRCGTQMLGHIVLTNRSTTLADYSSVSFMRHDVLKYSSDVLYNIYINIYKRQIFKPFSKQFFFKKIMK
jgi:hypothetical protein